MDTAAVVMDARQSIELTYRADSGRLWRAIYAHTGDKELANDAVAEAYAQAIRRGPGIHDPAAWTWRVAFRIAAGTLKARRDDDQRPISPEPIAHNDRYSDQDLIAALRRLPDGQRAAVILFYYEDLSVRQIADRLDTNQLAVRANLSRGRKRLRLLLGDDDD